MAKRIYRLFRYAVAKKGTLPPEWYYRAKEEYDKQQEEAAGRYLSFIRLNR